MAITNRITAAAPDNFEQKICHFLERNFESSTDSEGKEGFEKNNAVTQLDYMMSYVDGDREYIEEFKHENDEFKAELKKFLALNAPAQHKRLMKFFKKWT